MKNVHSIIQNLRQMVPLRPLSLNEAFALAEQQAARFLELIGAKEMPVDIAKVSELPRITVRMKPRHLMPNLAGFAKLIDGQWLIVINKDNVEGRRRFTLAHELKHILDHTVETIAYSAIGGGDQSKHDRHIEQICDYFAACVLMPAVAVKKMWRNGIQDVETLALTFRVSMAAMKVRLTYLGFLDDDRPVRSYFRADSGLTDSQEYCLTV